MGSTMYHDAAKHMQKGPSTLQEYADWPRAVLKKLFLGAFGSLRKARMKANIESGIICHGDFDGRHGPTCAMKMLQVAMVDYNVPLGWLTIWRASETKRALRAACLASEYPPMHLFKSVEARMDKECLHEVNKLQPRKEDSKETRAAAFASQDELICKKRKICFPMVAPVGACLRHPNAEC